MSSISSTSTLSRYLSRKLLMRSLRIELIISLVNFSAAQVADTCCRHAALHLVADGLHQVRLAHAHAAI